MRLFLLIVGQCFLWAEPPARPIGVLLLAHGGNAQWNNQIAAVDKALEQVGYPTEAAFGMADVAAMEKALGKLNSKNPAQIVCVPLFINSNSELYDQTAFVLGLKDKPSADFIEGMKDAGHSGHHGPSALDRRRVKAPRPLKLTSGLDDHPYVAQILLERARSLSRDPSKEKVLLISHGPYADAMETAWMKIEDSLARQLKELGGFADVRAFDLRDDSPADVRKRKNAEIRAYVAQSGKEGRQVLVLPHLIAMGGIEKSITKALEGLFYKISKEALLPHDLIGQWAISQVKSYE
ncbi:MAG: hypothetical protein HY547_09035 [Elusimicrobia bacterium]|nr:hypothetical protein [Elusimicrobiota bacterium]